MTIELDQAEIDFLQSLITEEVKISEMPKEMDFDNENDFFNAVKDKIIERQHLVNISDKLMKKM